MGNDGGSIPTRRELVKEAARNPTTTELKESHREQQTYLWSTDPLSRRPLVRPVVSDHLGRLFNKDSVIEFLLPSDNPKDDNAVEREELLKGAIKSLKDIVEVKLESGVNSAAQNGPKNLLHETWICPITNKELGPDVKAVYLVPCGHAFSELAIKEVSKDNICLQCGEAYASNDMIPILPTSEIDLSRLSLRMKTLKEKGLSHSLKKASGSSKKRKKHALEPGTAADVAEATTGAKFDAKTELQQPQESKSNSRVATPQPRSGTATPTTSVIKNAATASLTAKVLQEQEERNKRRKMGDNETLKSLFSKDRSVEGKGSNKDFMSRGFSIPAHQQR